MKLILPITVILLINISCDEKTIGSKDFQNANSKIDTSSLVINDRNGKPTIAILQKKSNVKRAVLTNREIEFISNITRLEVNKINPTLEDCFSDPEKQQLNEKYKLTPKDYAINLEKYNRQYEVWFNDKDQKMVYVNGFIYNPRMHPKWKTDLVVVDGGGSGYFSQTINLTTRQHQDFSINSPQ
jgi:hypothetical protein